MKSRMIIGIELTVLLMGMLTSAFNIQPVKASGTIYIRDDGSVEGTDKIQRNGNLYTFTGNINESLVIEKDNIIIDGAGYALGVLHWTTGTGIELSHRNNAIIKNIDIVEWNIAISLNDCSDISIVENIIRGNDIGISLTESFYNTMSGNIFMWSTQTTIELHESTNNNISRNSIFESFNHGIYLEASSYNSVSENNITSVEQSRRQFAGIAAQHSSNHNTIQGNYIDRLGLSTDHGIYIGSSSNNRVYGNIIKNMYHSGVEIYFSPNTKIYGNEITLGYHDGIEIDHSGTTYVKGNTIAKNWRGIELKESSNSWFYYNNFVNNTHQVIISGINTWDNGPSGGNYWSDYKDKYPDAEEKDESGIWNTPYVIDGNNRDNYPLVNPIPGYPIPTLVSVSIHPDSIETGEWATITLTARNDGGTAEWQTIHAGFPDNPRLENIEITSHDLNGGARNYTLGTELPANYGEYNITSTYVMVEGVHGPWETGEIHTMILRVKPQKTGTFTFYVKTVSRAEGVTYHDSTDTKDQQEEYVHAYEISVISPSPWEDSDGDSKENFLDLEWDMESLVDYGMPESRIYVEHVEYEEWGEFELAARMYLIAPETEEEVVVLTNWVKEHTASQDYDYITSELLDYYLPCFIAFETDKDVLTVLPMIGTLFDFLPGDNTYNWVRIITPLAFPDPLPILQIASSPGVLLSQLIYAFPCITDGDGYASFLTGEELLFRFTRPRELSLENVVDFSFDVLTLTIGQFLTGALPLKGLAKFAADCVIDFLFRLAWKWIKEFGQAVSEGHNNFLATLLEDPEGDVDMALFVDEEFVLGSYQNMTISDSTYGEYIADLPTELMITYTSQITNRNPAVVVTAQDVVQQENVSLQWMSFKEGSCVANGTFKELISEVTSPKEYAVVIENDTPRLIPSLDTIPPNVSILSPENETYRVNDVPLTFTVSETTSWIGYSLDGQANVTITGNVNLSELSDGSHSLIVYAKDTAGNTGISEIVYFSIETQKAPPMPLWIVAIVATIAGVGAALLVYFTKFKKQQKSDNKSRASVPLHHESNTSRS